MVLKNSSNKFSGKKITQLINTKKHKYELNQNGTNTENDQISIKSVSYNTLLHTLTLFIDKSPVLYFS